MVNIKDIGDILNYHHRHLHTLCVLVGIHELCKATGCNTLEELVNRYEMDPEKVRNIINELSYGDGFDYHITGDLYTTLLNVQLAADILPTGIQKGTMGWFLSLMDDENKSENKSDDEDDDTEES